MTSELQQYLKNTLRGCTDIPEQYIYMELREENEYNLIPFASILPDGAQIEPAWNNEQAYQAEDGRYTKVLRKYRVSQPWTIHIRRQTPEECTGDAEAFLAALHHKIVLGDTIAELVPRGMEFLLARGAMDHYEAKISLTAEYGVYTSTKIETIKNIALNAAVKER